MRLRALAFFLFLTPLLGQSLSASGLNHELDSVKNSKPKASNIQPIDSMVGRVMRSLRLVGATVAIVKDERLVYAQGYGYADLEAKEPVTPESKFRIGSISKLVTAVAVMKLVEDGEISLDDYVFGDRGILKGGVYDKVKNRNVYNIKVKHLLNHTAGWSLITYGDPMFIPHKIHKMDDASYPIDFDEVIEFVIERHLPYRPGTRYNYSNFGYCLLGRVIEEVTGDDYEDWVQDNVLEPNGIEGMSIAGNLLDDRQRGEVKYYDKSADNEQLSFDGSGEMVYKPYGADDIEMLGPAGGWLATATDLMRLTVMIDGYSKRYPDMLSKVRIDQMVKGVGGVNRPLGWRTTKGEHWWRTGTLSGTSALLTRDVNGYSWVIIANTTPRRGSFPTTSRWAMREGIKMVKSWPSTDLFNELYE